MRSRVNSRAVSVEWNRRLADLKRLKLVEEMVWFRMRINIRRSISLDILLRLEIVV